MKKLLQELVGLIYELNEKTDEEWFVDYAGHTNTVAVHFYKTKKVRCEQCGEIRKEAVWITHSTNCRQKDLLELIDKVNEYLPKGKG